VHELKPGVENRIRAIAARHEGPFYVYDRQEIRRICQDFLAIPWTEKSVHFATMANASPDVLRAVREAGLAAFVNSLGHLDLVLSLGFRPEEIVFTASAMDAHTMRRVHEVGVLVNLDSLSQAAAWQAAFPSAPAGLRCNIGDRVTPRQTRAGYFLGRDSRLGLTIPEIEVFSGATWVNGLHLYLGTDIRDLGHFRECYEILAELARLFPGLRYLDFGGGFGVPRDGEVFDFAAYGRMVEQVMSRVSRDLGRTVRLVLEPGRLISAEAGHFVCRVVDVKERPGRLVVGVNASSAQFPRPLLYPEDAFHPVTLLFCGGPRGALEDPLPTDVCGCSTYSRDYLSRGVLLPPARPGDLVVFGHAGAYCSSARSDFLGFPAAAEFVL
jgi:diaminopimelate decarboxylase